MKREKMLLSMNLIDDKYITEAEPKNTRKRSTRTKWAVMTVCACIVLVLTALNLWLFLPFDTTPPDISRYADSAYYPIIQKLNAASYSKPKYKNNFDRLIHLIQSVRSNKNDFLQSGTASEGESMHYREITDNQVAGVLEADRIKRSDRYIYYLDLDVLRVYSIEGESSKEIGSYYFDSQDENYAAELWEFYLSPDCRTVTVIAPYYRITSREPFESEETIELIALDVSDPAHITKKQEVSLTGSYLSSRLVGEEILLFSRFQVRPDFDFENEETFLPQIDIGSGYQSVPAENIVSPEILSNLRYTVVYKFDAGSLLLEDSAALLSYQGEIYVSNEIVYVTRSYSDSQKKNGFIVNTSMTEITGLSYAGDSLEPAGSVRVAGYIKDQYSLDEYNRLLRVVTTTSIGKYKEHRYGDSEILAIASAPDTSASLYCISLDTWQLVAEVKDFAPKGETVRSVRFDRENAYVCTSVQLSDPVFFFDLSDLNHIVCKDTGTIDGFSSSLVNFGNGYLLGIGTGSGWDTVKIEVYEETEDGVSSVCKYEFQNALYSTVYKSYLIDYNHHFIGLAVNYFYSNPDYENQSSRYVLLCFDGRELKLLSDHPLAGSIDLKRSVYVEGYLYMFGQNDFKVVQIDSAKEP